MILYQLFSFFIIYSFIGWVWETCLCSVQERQFVNRGFLNGPLCPVYGCGMVLLIVLLYPITKQDIQNWILNLALLFVGGMTVCTILEYITGWVLEKFFGATWWDYQDKRFNLHGRICLLASVFWGVMSTVLMVWVQPFFSNLVMAVPVWFGAIVIGLITMGLFIDFWVTVVSLLDFKSKLARMRVIRLQLREYIVGSELYDSTDEHLRALEMRFEDLIADVRGRLGSRRQGLLDVRERQIALLNELQERYVKHRSTGVVLRRVLKAFPRLTMKENQEDFTDMKNHMN